MAKKSVLEKVLETPLLKKIAVLVGAAVGGILGWCYAGPPSPGADIAIGVVIGAFVGGWIVDLMENDL
jgi:hypothetical protein